MQVDQALLIWLGVVMVEGIHVLFEVCRVFLPKKNLNRERDGKNTCCHCAKFEEHGKACETPPP